MTEAQNWKFHIDISQSIFCRAEKLDDALEWLAKRGFTEITYPK